MSEYVTIQHYVNHVMDEITKRDVEQVSERLRALGWEEVVRCRDCKHFTPKGTHKFESGFVNTDCCPYIRGFMLQITPDGCII